MQNFIVLWPEKDININISRDISGTGVFTFTTAFIEFIPSEGRNSVHVLEMMPSFKETRSSAYIPRIFFNNFTISKSLLKVDFNGFSYEFEYPAMASLRIRSINHSDVFPTALNRVFHNVEDTSEETCAYVLFFELEQPNESFFIGARSCHLKDLKKYIITELDDSNLSTMNVDMIHFQGNVAAEYIPIESELRNFAPSSVMTIRVKSSPFIEFYIDQVKWQIRDMAKIPKALLAWALTQLDGINGPLARRLALITVNKGVPIHLLNSLEDLRIDPINLQRFGLPLHSWSSVAEAVRSDAVLRFVSQNLIDAVKEDSSEATLRSHVWDPLLAALLFEPTRFARKFEGISEWNTKATFPQITDRHVDWAAIVRTFDIPVLFVEIGKDRVCPEFLHKDFTKLSCLMSQACFRLCVAMRNYGRDPKVVRVYGLLVGHSQFQFCVAHPVFIENLNENRIDLSVHLSFPDHWRFDLFEGGGRHGICRNNCCNYPNIFGGQIGTFGSLNLPVVTRIPVLPKIDEVTDDHDLRTHPPTVEVIVGEGHRARPVATVAPIAPLNRRIIDTVSLCKLKLFMNCVLDTIERIDSNRHNEYGNNPLPFAPLPNAIIPAALKSSRANTLGPGKVSLSPVITTTPPVTTAAPTVTIRKNVSIEAEFYKLLGKYSDYFPILFDSHVDEIDPKANIFTFEKLEHLTIDGNFNANVIRWNGPLEFILEGATFAVHVLFGLLILHENLGFVHSDISPSNIMFSPAFKTWKMNDFDQSMRIEDSLKVSRRAGTSDYIAPESLRSGIFTPASDVYALGQILLRYFYFAVGYDVEFNDTPKEIVNMTEEFRSIAAELVIPDPSQRSTVRQALRKFFDFTVKNRSEGFELYGFGIIFLKVEEFLAASEGENILNSSSSTSIPVSRIEPINVIPIN